MRLRFEIEIWGLRVRGKTAPLKVPERSDLFFGGDLPGAAMCDHLAASRVPRSSGGDRAVCKHGARCARGLRRIS